MVGSAGTHNGFLYLKTTKMYVLLHETVGSTEPTDGFLDPAMQETLVLLHETEGSEDPSNGFLPCPALPGPAPFCFALGCLALPPVHFF